MRNTMIPRCGMTSPALDERDGSVPRRKNLVTVKQVEDKTIVSPPSSFGSTNVSLRQKVRRSDTEEG
ncbi:hypothetical protein VMCG_05525 [Cytospora schulzeri]|uniref:Uncharacterized protein n=1 Tax=Cytospora schulzeri TaxID=448051 RepID=A0A423WFL7_9PEZI|nr:hypothetical protein VMCG_05525 [Valsa malicola]